MYWYDSKTCDEKGIKNQDAKIFKLIFLKTCAMVEEHYSTEATNS